MPWYRYTCKTCWKDYKDAEAKRTASLKNNGLWVVTIQEGPHSCTFLVEDATGKVREP